MWAWIIGTALATPPAHKDHAVSVASATPADVRLTPTQAKSLVHAARTHLGTAYRWEGRATPRLPGLDCLGILFRADEAVTGTAWRAFPVNPSELVAGGLLGAPAPMLDGVLRSDLDDALLQPGDILYFLRANYEIQDKPLWHHGEVPYWPWHTGLYVGDGNVLHASPMARVVVEEPLVNVDFDALFVTR